MVSKRSYRMCLGRKKKGKSKVLSNFFDQLSALAQLFSCRLMRIASWFRSFVPCFSLEN